MDEWNWSLSNVFHSEPVNRQVSWLLEQLWGESENHFLWQLSAGENPNWQADKMLEDNI